MRGDLQEVAMDISHFVVLVIALVMMQGAYLFTGYLSRSRFIRADKVFEALLAKQEEGTTDAKHGLRIVIVIIVFMTLFLLTTVCLMRFVHLISFAVMANGLCSGLLGFFIGTQLNPSGRSSQSIAGLAIGIACMILLSYAPSRLFANLGFVIMVVSMPISFKNIGFKTLLFISIGMLVYDAFNVYSTGLMGAVATSAMTANLPLIAQLPASIQTDSPTVTTVGLGDVIFPASWVMLAFRSADEHRNRRVILTTLLGNTLGWIVAMTACFHSDSGIPALIYLLPFTIGGYLMTAIPGKFHKSVTKTDETPS